MATAPKRGRPKGLPKTGGRKPGTPNRRTSDLVTRVEQAMGAGWCPIVALARIAEDKDTGLEMRVRCLSEVAPYLQAKRRALEHELSGSLEDLIVGQASSTSQPTRKPRPASSSVAPPPPASSPVRAPVQSSPVVVPPSPPTPMPEPALRMQDAYDTGSDFEPYG